MMYHWDFNPTPAWPKLVIVTRHLRQRFYLSFAYHNATPPFEACTSWVEEPAIFFQPQVK
jgi:hypothetical protein